MNEFSPNLLQRAARFYHQATLQQPVFHGQPTGALPAAFARTAWGALGGAGLGYLMGYNRREGATTGAVLGGLAGLGLSIPQMLAMHQMGEDGLAPQGLASQFTPITTPVEKSAAYGPSLGLGLAPVEDHTTAAQAANVVSDDPYMAPYQRAVAMDAIARATADKPHGLISTDDLIRGAVGSGLGYVTGTAVGRILGAVAGLPENYQRNLGSIGAVAGLMRAAGIWS